MIQSGNYGRLMEGGRKVKGKGKPKKGVAIEIVIGKPVKKGGKKRGK